MSLVATGKVVPLWSRAENKMTKGTATRGKTLSVAVSREDEMPKRDVFRVSPLRMSSLKLNRGP